DGAVVEPGLVFFFQAEDGIRDGHVTGVQTCALPIWTGVASIRVAKLKTNVSALIPNASAGPPNATARPPTVGPAMRARLRPRSRAAFPARSTSAGTRLAMIAVYAGRRKASAAPSATAAT